MKTAKAIKIAAFMWGKPMAVPRGLSDGNQRNALTCPTLNATPVGNKGKFSQKSNPKIPPEKASNVSAGTQDRIISAEKAKKAGDSVCRAVELDDACAYNGLMLIFASRLTERQRAGIAYAALSSLPDNHAYKTASLAIFGVLNGEVAT